LTTINDLTTLTMTLGDHVQQIKVMGTEVIGTFIPKEHILSNQIHGITDKKFYESGDEIVIAQRHCPRKLPSWLPQQQQRQLQI